MTCKIAKFHKCLIYFHVKFEPDWLKIDRVMAILLGKRILVGFFNRPVFEIICRVTQLPTQPQWAYFTPNIPPWSLPWQRGTERSHRSTVQATPSTTGDSRETNSSSQGRGGQKDWLPSTGEEESTCYVSAQLCTSNIGLLLRQAYPCHGIVKCLG